MKKRQFLPMALCLILAIVMCLALAACGSKKATQLSTPVVSVATDGTASWDAVEHASSYAYKISDGEEQTTNETSVTLTDGQSITVKAVGDGKSYTDSAWSNAISFTPPPIAGTKLTTPTVTVNEEGLASWAAVANATKYAYQIGNNDPVETENTSVMLTDGQSVKVKAVGNGTTYTDSDWSDAVTYTAGPAQLSAPTVKVHPITGVASWSNVTSATKYVYQIDDNDPVETDTLSVQLSDGQSIKVKAVGDGETCLDSEWSTAATFTEVALSTRAQFMSASKNDVLKIAGVVTAVRTSGSNVLVYLQDSDGGYYIYGVEETNKTLAAGDKITAIGKLDIYNGVYELKNATIVANGTEAVPAATDITDIFAGAASAQDSALVAKQNTLVSIKGVTLEVDGSSYYISIGAVRAQFFTSGNSQMLDSSALNAIKSQFEENSGRKADVTGFATVYSGNFQIIPTANALKIDETSTATLDTPDVKLDTATGVVSWNEVPHATGYKYKIDGAADVETDELSVTLTNGQSIQVKAVGDGETYLDSEYSESITYTEGALPTEAEFDFVEDIFKDLQLTGDKQELTNSSYDADGVTITFGKPSGSAPAVYSNKAARIYNGNTLTISANQTIKKIEFTTLNNTKVNGQFDFGVYNATTQTWYGNVTGSDLVLTSSATAQISKITVYLGELSDDEKVDLALMELPDISGPHNTDFTVTTTTANANLPVSWSVSVTDGDGNIVIADGNATVTRGENSDTTLTLTASVTSGSVTKIKDFTVTVTKKPTDGEHVAQWTKVTDISQLNVNNGETYKILITGTKSGQLMTFGTKQTNNFKATALDLSDPTIAEPSGATVLTLEKGSENGKYAISCLVEGKKQYFVAPGNNSNNYLKVQNDPVDCSIELTTKEQGDKEIAIIKFAGTGTNNWLRFNSGSALFSCYPETNSSQSDVSIYVFA